MPGIQVKDVPDDAQATLRRRAAAAGMSLTAATMTGPVLDFDGCGA